ncbi:MAG: hypothetical protein KDK10_04205 [Maritimibacter sp.]|nr:hypothetical protein [Maritimibacter sp.]
MSDHSPDLRRPVLPELVHSVRGERRLGLVIGAMVFVVGLLAFGILADPAGALDPGPAAVDVAGPGD